MAEGSSLVTTEPLCQGTLVMREAVLGAGGGAWTASAPCLQFGCEP